MIAYIIITIFLLWLGRKIKNPLITLLIGIFMILLYQSRNILQFSNSIIPMLDINNLLYNHRLLFLIIVLLLYLHVATLKTVGLQEKITHYISKIGTKVGDLYSLCLAPFSDFVDVDKNTIINPVYLNNKSSLSFLFIGSSTFIISYIILSTILSVNESFQIVLSAGFMAISLLLYNLINIIFSKNDNKIDATNITASGTDFFNMRFLVLTIMGITAAITIGMSFFGYYLLEGLALGLLCSLLFSVIYVDSHLFDSKLLDERNLFNNLLNQLYKWIKLLILVFALITFITLSIQVYTNNWEVTYSQVVYYFIIVVAISIMVSYLSDNFIYVPAVVIPLIIPILNLVSSGERIIVVACLFASIQVVCYLRNLHINKISFNKLFIPVSLISINIIVIVMYYLTHNLLICYVTIFVGVILLNVVNKLRKRHG